MAKSGTKILFGFTFFVLLVGGLAGGGAWYLTENRVEGYLATATLLVAGQDSGPLDGPGGGPGLRQRVQEAFDLPPHPMTTPGTAIAAPDYALLFSTDHMAATLKERMGEDLNNTSLEKVRHAMTAEAQADPKSRDHGAYRRVLTLAFTADSPELAAKAANTWAQVAVDFAEELSAGDRNTRIAALTHELKLVKDAPPAVQVAPQALPQVLPVAPLPRELRPPVDPVGALRSDLQALERSLARDEAALSTLKTYVSKAPVAVVLELTVKEAELETTLAGARAERDYLARQVAEMDSSTPAPEAEESPAPAPAPEAQPDVEIAQNGITDIRSNHSEPRIQSLEQAIFRASQNVPVLRMAAPAVAPESPVGPHRYVLVAGAAILGAILGMIVYFALLTLRVYARELDRT